MFERQIKLPENACLYGVGARMAEFHLPTSFPYDSHELSRAALANRALYDGEMLNSTEHLKGGQCDGQTEFLL